MLNMRTAVMALLAGAVLLALSGVATHASKNQFALNVDANGNAVAGYDTVAYFTAAKAIRGKPEFAHAWRGARWLFASAAHRDQFAREPEKYAPRMGGFCAIGVANGRMQEVDPELWLMVDGRLYLYLDVAVRDAALADLQASIAEAEQRWDSIAATGGN